MCSIYRSAISRVFIFIVSLLLVSLAGFSKAHAQSAAVQVINVSGGGEVNLTVRNVSNNQVAGEGRITWSNTQAGVTAWKVADQYIEISQEDLPVLWGIQLYTDNDSPSASPRYTGTADPAGLVKVANTIMTLPMAWRITDQVLSGAERADPVERSDGEGFDDYLWHFLKDKNTLDNDRTPVDERFVNGGEYETVWNQAGIAWNEGGRAGNPKKAYIYFASKFTMASVNAEYETSRLILEAYHEGVLPFPIYLYRDAPQTEWPNEPGAVLDNHFAPSGWMNYDQTHNIINVNSRAKDVTPHSGSHSFRIQWNGNSGVDGWRWGGVMWLEPEDIWGMGGSSPTHNGYDLRGADYLSFWARTSSNNVGLQIKAYFGNTGDSCGQTPPLWRTPALTTTWQQYIIPVLGRDMSDVTGGLAIVFADDHDPDPDGCTIYLDDVKFDRY